MKYLEDQGIKLMGHPTYSPDLSLCDCYLFQKCRGKNFRDMNEVDAAVQEQIEDFYQYFEYWFKRMNKCIRVQGH